MTSRAQSTWIDTQARAESLPEPGFGRRRRGDLDTNRPQLAVHCNAACQPQLSLRSYLFWSCSYACFSRICQTTIAPPRWVRKAIDWSHHAHRTSKNRWWYNILSIFGTYDRQSKLSQEQLNQLQKDTHFDKKELQQWYKGQGLHLAAFQYFRSPPSLHLQAF